jgi:recombinational DNA repair protein RecR
MNAFPPECMQAVIQQWINRPGEYCREALQLLGYYLAIPSSDSGNARFFLLRRDASAAMLKAHVWNEFINHLAACEACGRFDVKTCCRMIQ